MSRCKKFIERSVSAVVAFAMMLSMIPSSFSLAAANTRTYTERTSTTGSNLEAELAAAGGSLTITGMSEKKYTSSTSNVLQEFNPRTGKTYYSNTYLGIYNTPGGSTGRMYCVDHSLDNYFGQWMNYSLKTTDKVNDPYLLNTYYMGFTDTAKRGIYYFLAYVWPVAYGAWGGDGSILSNICSTEDIQSITEEEWAKATQIAIWSCVKTPSNQSHIGIVYDPICDAGNGYDTSSKEVMNHRTDEEALKQYKVIRWSDENMTNPSARRIYAATIALKTRVAMYVAEGIGVENRNGGFEVRPVEEAELKRADITVDGSVIDFTNTDDEPGKGTPATAYAAINDGKEDPKLDSKGVHQITYNGKRYYVIYLMNVSKSQADTMGVKLEGNFPEGTVVAPLWSDGSSSDPDTKNDEARLFGAMGLSSSESDNNNTAYVDSVAPNTDLGKLPEGRYQIYGVPITESELKDTPGESIGGVVQSDMGSSAIISDDTREVERASSIGWVKVMIPADKVEGDDVAPADFKVVYYTDIANAYDCYVVHNMDYTNLQPMILGDVYGSFEDSITIRWGTPQSEGEYQFKVRKVDSETDKGLAGAEFTATNEKGETIVKTTDENGYATFTYTDGQYQSNTWTVVETAPPPGYENKGTTLTFENVQPGAVQEQKVKNSKGIPVMGDDIVIKLDAETKMPLAGAIFNFKGIDKDNNVEHKFTTQANGSFSIQWWDPAGADYVKPGSYEVTEISAPSGYNLDTTTVQTIELGIEYDEYGNMIPWHSGQLIFENVKKPNIVINKVDGAGNLLDGAYFDVYFNEQKIDSVGPTFQGQIIYSGPDGDGVVDGTYKFVETVAPENYILNSQPHTVVVDVKDGDPYNKVGELTIVNYSYPPIEILKIDTETEEPLAGAEFDVYLDGKLLGRYTSGEDGKVTITWEEYGPFLGDAVTDERTWTVRVEEVNAPENYNRDYVDFTKAWTQEIEFDMDTMNKIEFLFDDHEYRDIEVVKLDADNDWKLGGATFELECISLEDPSLQKPAKRQVETEEGTGVALFENVPNGSYILREIDPPEGYQSSDIEIPVEVTSTSENVIHIEYRNEPLTGLVIRKVDAVSHQPVPGCKFEITGYTNDGESFGSIEKISDSNGLVTLENIEPGVYTIKETAVPDGYILDDTPRTITVTEDHQSTYYEFENNSESALYILKLNSLTGLPVPGVRFSVSTAGGTHVADVVTGENGYARLSGLEPGGYVVKEIWAPNDMIVDPTPQTFEVKPDDSGKTYELVFYNQQKTVLVIQKIDSVTREPLEGAYFTIRAGNGAEIAVNQRTDKDGLIILPDLLPGTYVIEEIRSPEGYVLTEGEQRVYLEANTVKNIVLENDKEGGITIQKVDADTGAQLPGASFVLYDLDDKLIGTYTDDDKDGYIQISGLAPGQYFIKEIKAPDGYILSSELIKVRVDTNKITTVKVENSTKSPLVISKIDSTTGLPLAGAKFTVSSLDGMTIRTGVTDENGKLVLTGIDPGWYNITEIEAPEGYVLNTEVYTIEVKEGKTATVEITNTPQNGLWLKKVDAETLLPLAGATFEIYTMDDELIGEYTTNTSGTINTTNLLPGHYKLRETKAPDGYVLDKTCWTLFEMVEGETTMLTIKNWKQPVIRMEKYDKYTNERLAGAEFEISTLDGHIIGTYTTDVNGEAYSIPLDYGTYIVKEVKAPDGYKLSGCNETVVVEKGYMPEIIKVYNEPLSNVSFVKVDGLTKKPLEGASFEIRADDGTVVKHVTTDSNGLAFASGLGTGAYKLVETQAPEGYVLSGDHIDFYVEADKEVVVTVDNYKSAGLIIRKVDAETGKLLQGAKFQVESSDGNIAYTGTTDASGIIMTGPLDPGVYNVREISAPDGYILDTNPQMVELDFNETRTVEFKNSPMSALLIEKIDSITGDTLEGARFKVTNVLTDEVVTEGVTGKDGLCLVSDLEPGKYLVEEIVAPDGYLMDTDPIIADVKLGMVAHVTFFNTPMTGIIIDSIDTATGEPLAGSVFEVWKQNGDKVADLTTDATGRVQTNTLTPGYYVIKQTYVANGYTILTEPQTVEVKAGKEPVYVTFESRSPSNLIIRFEDSITGIGVADATFDVYEQNGKYVGTYYTVEDGSVPTLNLPAGFYLIKLKDVPYGYEKSYEEKTVEVTTGKSTTVVFKGVAQSTMVIVAKDNKGNTITNATFEVKNMDNSSIGTFTTDITGSVTVPGLVPGFYRVVNIEVPNGYQLNEDEEIVQVKAGSIATVTFVCNVNTGAVINMRDSAGNPVKGVQIEIKKQNGNIIGTYTSDTTGVINLPSIEPGYYEITIIKMPAGYSIESKTQTIQIDSSGVVWLNFDIALQGTLTIHLSDASSKTPISGAKFKLTEMGGNVIGEYTTDSTGYAYTGELESGWYVLTQISTADGYVVDSESRNVEIKSGENTSITLTNGKVCGLNIYTMVSQTNAPVAGATYSIEKLNGERMGTFTSDAQGMVYVSLDAGTYVVTQISLPDGMTVDSAPRNVVVNTNQTATLTYTVSRLSSMRIHVVDATTGKGLYGMRFLLKKQSGELVGEYTTDDQGYIRLDKVLMDGYYTLEMIPSATSGNYATDNIPKTIQILNGQTTEVKWGVAQIAGQIQVVVKSNAYNSMTNQAEGSLLAGAVFEIYNPDTFVVVDTITSDINGVAASQPLPIGRYIVRQKSAAPYFSTNPAELEAKLKVANDVVRLEYVNAPAVISVTNTIKSNVNVNAGSYMRVDFTAINNASSTELGDFYWHIKIPTDCARAGTLFTGTWNTRAWYTISYKTNMKDYRQLSANMLSTNTNNVDFSSTSLGLQTGEYVTDIRVNFGNVPGSFKVVSAPSLYLYVMPNVYNGYKCIVRSELGGKIGNEWQTATATWTTNVANNSSLPGKLPTTGY